MNRPNQAYCFLPDKHYKSNYKIIREFAKEVIKECIKNEDGVQLPHPFGFVQIIGYTEVSVIDKGQSRKNNKRIKHQNYNTDGIPYVVGHTFKSKSNRSTLEKTKDYHFKMFTGFAKAITKAVNEGLHNKWYLFRNNKHFKK